jgi:beta-glucanase (GH16 family)
MNSSNQNQSTWPACGEIDIAEMQGGLNDKRLLGTIHFGTAYPDSHYSLGAGITHGENLGNGWHVYGVSWDEAGVRWTFDGEEYGSTSFNPLPGTDGNGKPIDTSLANTGAFTAQTGFAVILNLAVGGNFFGDPNTLPPDSILNDPDKRDERSLLVDWVRVYEE